MEFKLPFIKLPQSIIVRSEEPIRALADSDEYGWVKIEGFLDEKEIKQAQKEIEKFVSQAKQELKGREINFVGDKINSIHKLEQSKWVNEMMQSKRILDLVDQLAASCQIDWQQLRSDPRIH